MNYLRNNAITVGRRYASDISESPENKERLIESFYIVCKFLQKHPELSSWRKKTVRPDLEAMDEFSLGLLAEKYFQGYKKSGIPSIPSTVPDTIVSYILQYAYKYDSKDLEFIKVAHQYSMCAENCVGDLLEGYIDSELRPYGWAWCCGELVKSIDFLHYDEESDKYTMLQVKNRDNSENSSSSSVRNETDIIKWFRTFSRTGATNWEKFPFLLPGGTLTEEGFISFVSKKLC